MSGVTNEHIMAKYHENNFTASAIDSPINFTFVNPVNIAATLTFTVGMVQVNIRLEPIN